MEPSSKVAPILNAQKLPLFFSSLFSTLLGISIPPCGTSPGALPLAITLLTPLPSLFILLFPLLSPTTSLYSTLALITTIPPTLFIYTLILLKHFLIDRKSAPQPLLPTLLTLLLRFLLTPVTCYLSFNHFLLSGQQLWLSLVSFITLLGSLSTLVGDPVKEFGVMNEESGRLGWRSSYLVRVYLVNAVLIVETVMYFLGYGGVVEVIKYVYCFGFMGWWLGIVGDLTTMVYVLINWVNLLVFGEQKKVKMYRGLISLVINAGVSIGIMAIPPTTNHYFPIINSVLMGTAILTSSLLNTICCFPTNALLKSKHYYLEHTLQLLLLAGKITLSFFIPPVTIPTLLIILGADLFIYLLLSLVIAFGKSRTFFGTHQLYTLPPYTRTILRFIMRAIIDISFVFLSERLLRESGGGGDWKFVLGVLVYRGYKRAVYEPFSVGVHLGMAIGMAVSTVLPVWRIVIPLGMVPLPDNPLLMFVAPFIIPDKNVHNCQNIYKPFYLLGSLITLAVLVVSVGLLEPLMLFGLPLFLWSLPLTTAPLPNAHGKDKSIHQHLATNLKQIISHYEVGTYLLRISKYLVIARVLQKGIGYQVVEFRGLEAQEVTSCHGIEAQTVDNMVEETWGEGRKERQCGGLGHLMTVLRPVQKHPYELFESNEISLVGVIDTREFAEGLRENYVKVLLCLMKEGRYEERYGKELGKVSREIGEIASEKEVEKYRFEEYLKELGVTVTEGNNGNNNSNKKHLPPLKKQSFIKEQPKVQPPPIPSKPKLEIKKSVNMFDEFDFMMSPQKPSVKSPSQKPPTIELQNKTDQQSELNLIDKIQQVDPPFSRKKLLFSDQSPKSLSHNTSNIDPDLSSLTTPSIFETAVALCIYSLGTHPFLDQKKLFSLLSSPASAQKHLKNLHLPPKGLLATTALRYSFKLTIQQHLFCQPPPTLSDILPVLSLTPTSHIGLLTEPSFELALQSKLPSIWSLDYKDDVIKVNRYAEREVELYVFEMDEFVVKGVWNNLRFELLYVTNDDDERYSIQTHPRLLRNVVVEGAVEPMGYAGYYSGYEKVEER